MERFAKVDEFLVINYNLAKNQKSANLRRGDIKTCSAHYI